MRVLFVYYGLENLGLGILSSVLKNAGHDTDLAFDPALFNDAYLHFPTFNRALGFDREVLAQARAFAPDVIAFGAFTENYRWALNMAERMKAEFGVPIVFGGIHTTLVPEVVMENEYIDYAIAGEGEGALLDLVNGLEAGSVDPDTPNLCLRVDGAVRINPRRELIFDLDSIPFPDKDMFYRRAPHFQKEYKIVTSRGCPYECSFCCVPTVKHQYGVKRIRRRSVDNVLDELEWAANRYDIEYLNICDDNFFFGDKWLVEFADKYMDRVGIPYRCMGHPLLLTKKNTAALKRSNCTLVQIGVQTASDQTRQGVIDRPEGNAQVARAGEYLRDNAMPFEVDHILGLPFEEEQDFIDAARLYKDMQPDQINCYWFKIFPRAGVIPHALEAGLITDADVRACEEGYGMGYVGGGSVKDRRLCAQFQIVHALIPLLSPNTIEYILDKRVYRYFNFGFFSAILLRGLKHFGRSGWKDLRFYAYGDHYWQTLKARLLHPFRRKPRPLPDTMPHPLPGA